MKKERKKEKGKKQKEKLSKALCFSDTDTYDMLTPWDTLEWDD